MFYVYSDPIAARWVDDGLPIGREEVAPWIAKTQENYRHYGYGMSAITERNSGDVIGFIGLVHPGGQVEPEIKYSLFRLYWGRGIASEAVRGMIEYGKREHRLEEIIATLSPENGASQRVLQKAGLSFREDRIEEDGSTTRVMGWSVFN